MSKRAQAFTLLELLVVIAIIGILMALLFPTAKGVFTGANEVYCQNNLGQLAKVALSYCTMNNDQFPPPCYKPDLDTNIYKRGWLYGKPSGSGGPALNVDEGIFVRQKLLGSKPSLVCPADVEEWGLMPGSDSDNVDAWKITLTRDAPRLTARSGVVMSSYAMNAHVWSRAGSPAQPRKRRDFSDGHFLFVEEHPTTSTCTDGAIEAASTEHVADRHRGGGYIACMDGRVIYMTTTEFDATTAAAQRPNFWTPF